LGAARQAAVWGTERGARAALAPAKVEATDRMGAATRAAPVCGVRGVE